MFRRKNNLRNEGVNLYTSGRVSLRNAPANGEYRVVDRYGNFCLQSSEDGENWVFVEIFDDGYRGNGECEPPKWEILGTQKPCTKERLLNVARQILGEAPVIVEYLDKRLA